MAGPGRPSLYTDELAAAICERLAAGESLRAICRDEGMPAHSTVLGWVNDNPDFSDQYTRAREKGYAVMFDHMLEIADTPQQGVTIKESEKGTEVRTGDMIEHRRLRVDTRKWMLAKALPKIYGDRLDLNHGGTVNIAAALDAAHERLKNARGA